MVSTPALEPTKTTTAPAPLPAEEPVKGPTIAAESTAIAQPAPASTATTAHGNAPATAYEEIEEPQNPLTKKFTEAEWKALKEFRVRNPLKCIFMLFNKLAIKAKIPSVLEDAYSDSDKPERRTSPIALWGVIIDPTGKANDARASVALMKFLRARLVPRNTPQTSKLN